MGYLAQHPRFYATMTPRQTLRFAARFFYTGPAAFIERRVRESLALVSLMGKADRPLRGFARLLRLILNDGDVDVLKYGREEHELEKSSCAWWRRKETHHDK